MRTEMGVRRIDAHIDSSLIGSLGTAARKALMRRSQALCSGLYCDRGAGNRQCSPDGTALPKPRT